MDIDLSYIFEEVDEAEYFVPKKGRDPAKAKRRDAKGARRQLYMWMNGRGGSEHGFSKNGIPYAESYKDNTRTQYFMNGFDRHSQERGNGRKEHVRWDMGLIEGKNSRVHNKMVASWNKEVNEALDDEGF